MKAVLQNLKTGKAEVGEVPPPVLRPNGVLVGVRRSLISLGTERAVLELARKGPIGKARDRPDLARKVLNRARQEGVWNTVQVVRNLLDSPIPLGYSCSGQVLEVGSEVSGLQVGQRVACAGLNHANHAEVDFVPARLVAQVPDEVSDDDACFVTVGAIAMHGVRLASLELGETVLVLGLGLVGQLAAQLARCSGATVVVSDVDEAKVELALSLGAHQAHPSGPGLAGAVRQLTGGHGADAVLVCAASRSSRLMALAVDACRLRARVVVVGDVGMDLERRPFFEKEASVVVSRSYGPGRYDPAYENRGIDYPLPYVRWTENRNMSSFLELLARREVRVAPLVTHRYPIEEAEKAYEIVGGERQEPAIGIVLEYGAEPAPDLRVPLAMGRTRPRSGLTVGVIGAGQFAKGILLPAFARTRTVAFRAFCTASGLTSRSVAERYGAAYCTSDPAEVLEDPQIDAVVIATRHDQHAPLTARALRQGKAVFVEKPLAVSPQALFGLDETIRSLDFPARLMVGYNRRFAPLLVRCREFFVDRKDPLFALYRVNAGPLPPDSWVLDPVEGGGRIVSEVCHFVDTLLFLTGSRPAEIHAAALDEGAASEHRDSGVSVTMRFGDGSIGVIHYLTKGAASLSKEYLEVFAEGRTAVLDNYRRLALHAGNRARRQRLLNQDKGHAGEVQAFVQALERGEEMPIDLETLVAVSQATFLIQRSLRESVPVRYAPPAPPEPHVGEEA